MNIITQLLQEQDGRNSVQTNYATGGFRTINLLLSVLGG